MAAEREAVVALHDKGGGRRELQRIEGVEQGANLRVDVRRARVIVADRRAHPLPPDVEPIDVPVRPRHQRRIDLRRAVGASRVVVTGAPPSMVAAAGVQMLPCTWVDANHGDEEAPLAQGVVRHQASAARSFRSLVRPTAGWLCIVACNAGYRLPLLLTCKCASDAANVRVLHAAARRQRQTELPTTHRNIFHRTRRRPPGLRLE